MRARIAAWFDRAIESHATEDRSRRWEATKSADGDSNEQVKADEATDRVSGEAEDVLAVGAESIGGGLAGAEIDAVEEPFDAELFEGGRDEVERSLRHAADGHDDGLFERGGEGGIKGSGVVAGNSE